MATDGAGPSHATQPADEPIDAEDEEEDRIRDDAFEREYANDHSWEALQEDERGRLRPVDTKAAQRARRQRVMSAAQTATIRKGMIRHTLLVVDLSKAASSGDLRPSRLVVMVNVAKAFIRAFFDQNPLSQLALAVMKDGVTERLTDLSGSPEKQVAALSAAMEAVGEASLQNALELGIEMLKGVPAYGQREMLFLFAALSTCDPGDIFATIKKVAASRIRVSIVGVAAEVYICRRIVDATGGTYGVATSEAHLEELMMQAAPPPPVPQGQLSASLVRMGFPQRASEDPATSIFVGRECVIAAGSYTCPRCKARIQELPSQCHVCQLVLISSPHLARSYHHLFPVKPYVELEAAEIARLAAAASANGSSNGDSNAKSHGDGMDVEIAGSSGRHGRDDVAALVAAPWQEAGPGLQCFGCLRPLGGAAADGTEEDEGPERGGMVLRCPSCRQLFCFECDAYVHESLHNCPGCECACVSLEDEGGGTAAGEGGASQQQQRPGSNGHGAAAAGGSTAAT